MNTLTTFVLIADGGRARLLSRTTRAPQLLQLEDWDHEAGRLPDHLSETDNLGSTGGNGQHHSTMTPTNDPKRHSQQVFAKKLADYLKQSLSSYDQLLVAASPKFLGDLRKEFCGEVSKKIIAELDKDLTHVALHDLGAHLDPLVQA